MIGYFIETAELCERAGYKIVGIVDKTEPLCCPYEYLGDDQIFINRNYSKDIPLILVPDLPSVRKKLFDIYSNIGFHFETVISPLAFISPSATISEGCMIQDGCNISSNVRLGKCVRINSLANVMHDADIGDFSTIAPSSVVLGHCSIKELVYVGANATLLPGINIQSESIVGAGAVVTKSVDNQSVVVGVPAKER